MRRTPDEVYAALIAAGWPPDAAVTMTAIAGAESGYDTDALGDLGLADATWGPSYGLFQIRTLKSDTGSGSARDITRLAASEVEQARAALQISGGGRDFTPWSVYSTGAYLSFLPAAQAAAQRFTGDDDLGGPLPYLGPEWAPWNLPARVGNEILGQGQELAAGVLGGARHVALEGAFIGAGLVLAGAGVYLLVRAR